MSTKKKSQSGLWVLISFCTFFGVIIVVNGVFITTALNTHNGTITDHPYEKGLAYDSILDEAKHQPDLNHIINFEDNTLRVVLKDSDQQPLEAFVTAQIVRPITTGHDFIVEFEKISPGQYEKELNLPMKGSWKAKIKAQWNEKESKKTYQAQHSFVVN